MPFTTWSSCQEFDWDVWRFFYSPLASKVVALTHCFHSFPNTPYTYWCTSTTIILSSDQHEVDKVLDKLFKEAWLSILHVLQYLSDTQWYGINLNKMANFQLLMPSSMPIGKSHHRHAQSKWLSYEKTSRNHALKHGVGISQHYLHSRKAWLFVLILFELGFQVATPFTIWRDNMRDTFRLKFHLPYEDEACSIGIQFRTSKDWGKESMNQWHPRYLAETDIITNTLRQTSFQELRGKVIEELITFITCICLYKVLTLCGHFGDERTK